MPLAPFPGQLFVLSAKSLLFMAIDLAALHHE
jgi:hypothetical protein